MRNRLHSHARPSGPLNKLAALLVAVVMIALLLMFSVVIVAVVLLAGSIAWGYFWWKTRALRKQMRNQPSAGIVMEEDVIKGEVIEGEVIRVYEPGDAK